MFEDRGVAPPEPGERTCEDPWPLSQPLLLHALDGSAPNPDLGGTEKHLLSEALCLKEAFGPALRHTELCCGNESTHCLR